MDITDTYREHTSLCIGGDRQQPLSTETYTVVSPATEEEIGRVPVAGAKDIDAAVAAARRALDTPGASWATSTPAERADVMERLADAVALIGRLGLGPVHYVGLSTGGFVGQRIAARHGGLLRSLTLLDTSADEEDPAKAREYRLMANVYRLTGVRPVLGKVKATMFGPAFLASPASETVVDEWVRRLRRCERAGIRKAVLGVADRSPVHDELARVRVPTLVVVGADDVATPRAEAERIATAITGARLEVVADSGHSSTLEQPAALTALIRDFLASADHD